VKFKAISGERIQVRNRIIPFISRNFIWVLVLIIWVGAGIANPVFWSVQNLLNILNANAYLGCLVIGTSFILITANMDLSIESNVVLSACVGGILMLPRRSGDLPGFGKAAGGIILRPPTGLGWPWPLALAGMMGVSSLVGLINGLLVVKGRLNPFMVTLAGMVSLLGLAMLVAKGRAIVQLPDGFKYIGSATIGSIPVSVIFMAVVFVIIHVVLTRTVFGSNVYAVGGNRRAARAAGINDDLIIITAFTLSGFFSGLSAFLLVGKLGCASAEITSGALFLTIAAAVVGGISLYGGRGSVPSMIGGLLLMGMIQNAMNMANVPFEYVRIVTGVVIVIAIGIDALRRRSLTRE